MFGGSFGTGTLVTSSHLQVLPALLLTLAFHLVEEEEEGVALGEEVSELTIC